MFCINKPTIYLPEEVIKNYNLKFKFIGGLDYLESIHNFLVLSVTIYREGNFPLRSKPSLLLFGYGQSSINAKSSIINFVVLSKFRPQ